VEVHFYFRAKIQDEVQAFALADLYSQPDEEFLEESYHTVWSYGHGQGEHLAVVPVQNILAVVAMIPHSIAADADKRYRAPETTFFLVEKPGLDVIQLTGYKEEDTDKD
jgi:hypothetical protein